MISGPIPDQVSEEDAGAEPGGMTRYGIPNILSDLLGSRAEPPLRR
jgi:hypothetical protein